MTTTLKKANAPFDPQVNLTKLLNTLKNHVYSFTQNKNSTASQIISDPLENCEESNPIIRNLMQQFNLSPFERNVLLLCAGIELDSELSKLCSKLQGDLNNFYPTLGLALTLFSQGSWQMLASQSPLHYWGLIEKVSSHASLAMTPLKISEKILHSLMGISSLHSHLNAFLKPNYLPKIITENYLQIAHHIENIWKNAESNHNKIPLIYLRCEDLACAYHIATLVAEKFNVQFHTLDIRGLPPEKEKQQKLQILMTQEALLEGCFYLINCDDASEGSETKERPISPFIEYLKTMPLLFGHNKCFSHARQIINIEVKKPTVQAQKKIWQQELQAAAVSLSEASLEHIVGHFNFSPTQIHKNIAETKFSLLAEAQKRPENSKKFYKHLWRTCVTSGRKKLEGLIKIVEPKATWEDLALPYKQQQTLKLIIAQVAQRYRVYHRWGFADKTNRGLGMSALFAGPSGTGKTLAAEIIAKELGLDLYHVDLSSLVSKYIGETEKNLSKVFSVAEESGAILLFDEADALFAKRSDVKDSHDRYANMEVSYLLQRIEAYQGLSILTTNLKSVIDEAFLRRIRFIVHFLFPSYDQRQEIWRKIFPSMMPKTALDPAKLAHLPIAGGNISAVALNAAFIAAHEGEEITMAHIRQAAQAEYLKLDRILTEKEIKDWT